MSQTLFPIAFAPRCRGRRALSCAVAMLVGGLAAGASPAADYGSLAQVEAAAETRDYSQQVRDKKFAAAQQAYLNETLLPQLSKDANRAGIARTRQRIRELALRDAAKEVFDPINGLLRDAMVRQAAAAEAEPLIRVNAMLLVGELVGADGKPWPAAAKGRLGTARGHGGGRLAGDRRGRRAGCHRPADGAAGGRSGGAAVAVGPRPRTPACVGSAASGRGGGGKSACR